MSEDDPIADDHRQPDQELPAMPGPESVRQLGERGKQTFVPVHLLFLPSKGGRLGITDVRKHFADSAIVQPTSRQVNINRLDFPPTKPRSYARSQDSLQLDRLLRLKRNSAIVPQIGDGVNWCGLPGEHRG